LKVVVVGAGEVGYTVAKSLSQQGHDVTLVEKDEMRASKVENELDVMVVRGNGARPPILEKAGIAQPKSDVDILIACTDHDEVNILACWIAKRAGVPKVISRARGLEYTDSPEWARELGIDVMISPERSVARQIEELLSVSASDYSAEFFGGVAGLYTFKVSKESPLIGHTLKDVRAKHPSIMALIAYVERDGGGFVPFGETKLQPGDLCFVITLKGQLGELEELFQRQKSRKLRRVIIVGGGKIGFRVAKRLETRYPQLDIRLIDQDREKCDKLARELERTIVLVGDGADEELLRREGVEGVDGFVATTANDERNILMGVIGKALGANKSIAVVRRGFFEKLDKYLPVDAMVNPNEALASVIMRYVLYPSAAGGLSIIERIDAEILEVTISKDSSALGVKISEIGFPKGALIALVYRRGQVFVPTGDTKLEDGDQVVLFASSDKMQQALDILGVKVS